VKIDRINEDILKLIQDGAKTGTWDNEKIQGLYFKLLSLDSSDGCSWIKIDEIDPIAIEWLWWNRIPRGSITLLVSDPGDGKSMLATFLCAKITKIVDISHHPI